MTGHRTAYKYLDAGWELAPLGPNDALPEAPEEDPSEEDEGAED